MAGLLPQPVYLDGAIETAWTGLPLSHPYSHTDSDSEFESDDYADFHSHGHWNAANSHPLTGCDGDSHGRHSNSDYSNARNLSLTLANE